MNKLNIHREVGDIDNGEVAPKKKEGEVIKISLFNECQKSRQSNNNFETTPLAKSADYKRCRKQIIFHNKPLSLLHSSLKHQKDFKEVANNEEKMDSSQYRIDLKQAAREQKPEKYFAILGEYYDLNCTHELAAKYYAYAFYVAEHYGCPAIKKHIYGVVSKLLSSKISNDLGLLVCMLQYKKEFYSIYPQMIALLQVYINESVQNLNLARVKEIYLAEIPEDFLRKNYTYLVEIPMRYAKQIKSAFPDKQDAKEIFQLLANLKARLYL